MTVDELERELTYLKHRYETVEQEYLATHSLTGGMINHHEAYTMVYNPLDIAIILEERRHYLNYQINKLEQMQELLQAIEPQTEEDLQDVLTLFKHQRAERRKQERRNKKDYKHKLNRLELERATDHEPKETIMLHVQNLTEAERFLAGKEVYQLRRERLPKSYLVTASVGV